MAPKKKSTLESIGDDQLGDGDPLQKSDQDSLSEYPISEGSDESASRAQTPADDTIQDALQQSTYENVAAGLLSASHRRAIDEFEDEMSARPWSTFVAG